MPLQTREMQTACRTQSVLDARFTAKAGRTALARVHETGAFRLRLQRGAACVGTIVNTGGGILAGDTLRQTIRAEAGAEVVLTSVAAEKIYRSDGAAAVVETGLHVGPGARLDWLPQETILFDGARLSRSLRLDLAETACALVIETIVFGRLANGETSMAGAFTDAWDVGRAGRLVFADRVRLDGTIGATLDRPAVGGGARAVATVLLAAPDAAAHVEPLRLALQAFAETVESGVSVRDGVLVARLLARSPERLRAAMVGALGVLRRAPLPRTWC